MLSFLEKCTIKKIDGELKTVSPKEAEYLDIDNCSDIEKLQKQIKTLKEENEKLKSTLNNNLVVTKWQDVKVTVSLRSILEKFKKGTIKVSSLKEWSFCKDGVYEIEIENSKTKETINVDIQCSEYERLVGTKQALYKKLNFDTIDRIVRLFREELPEK